MGNKKHLEMVNKMYAAISNISIAIFDFRNKDIGLSKLRKIVKMEIKKGLLYPIKSQIL